VVDKVSLLARRINQLRVFPRIYLTVFFILYVVLVAESWSWYTALDLKDIEAANLILITAFPVALITALGGMFTKMYIAYQSYQDTSEIKDE
jgi:hypothetical protein